jgi:hypothetical protein
MNAKDGGNRPVYTIKYKGETIYAREIDAEGRSKAVYERQAAFMRRSGMARGSRWKSDCSTHRAFPKRRQWHDAEPTGTLSRLLPHNRHRS